MGVPPRVRLKATCGTAEEALERTGFWLVGLATRLRALRTNVASFSLEQASADVAAYEDVVNKSILEFPSYSVFEKQELYTTLAKFNVELLQKLLAIKKENSFD